MRRFVAVGFCILALMMGVTIMFIEHRNRISSALYLAGCQITPMEQALLPGVGTFSVVHLDCDHGEKEEYVDVYASGKIKNVSHWWSDRGTLIFRYDPKNSQVPTITRLSTTQIVIAVPTVSSVAIKVEKWKSTNIRYEIGHYDYP